MRSATHYQNSHLSLVTPNPVHRTVDAHLASHDSHIQELTGILQTTLKLNVLLELFARKLRQYVALDGIAYQRPESDAEPYLIGKDSQHRATYDLKLESLYLGELRFYRRQHLSRREIGLLENLLSTLIYPLRNALEYKRALEMASCDALTGIQNRHALDNALQREVELAQRNRTPLSILVLDADHFKQFNDTYGHAFGDAVLKTLADTIAATIRGSDLLFRFGGEEFVVLTSQTVSDGAYLLAERIRNKVAGIHRISNIDVHVTLSLGVASLQPGENGATLFERADRALYAAKQKGRNRTEIAEQL